MDAYYNLTISSSAYKFKCSMLTSLYKRKYSSNSHELLFCPDGRHYGTYLQTGLLQAFSGSGCVFYTVYFTGWE